MTRKYIEGGVTCPVTRRISACMHSELPAVRAVASVARVTCGTLAALAAILAVQPRAVAEEISADLLRGPAVPVAVVPNALFVPPAAADAAHEPFEGTLKLAETKMTTVPANFKATRVLGREPQVFPGASVAFFTENGDLVPVTQEVIRVGSLDRGRSFWDLIVQPGRVWSDPSDKGWSRAAFPFALVNSLEGETHNGLALFLYRRHHVSRVRIQIVQQTAPYYVTDRFTAAALLPVTVAPLAGVDRTALARRYKASLADAVPVADWATLERKVGADALAGFDGATKSDDNVLSGLDDGTTFYLKSCDTAAGPLPWCDRARFGVWSATKALLASTALLRLAEKYGQQVFDLRIRDYVPALGDLPAWRDVRFRDAIDMATGVGEGSTRREPNDIGDGYLAPADTHYDTWYEARSRADKVAAIAQASPAYPWGPGQVARYRDQDFFILGVAMDGLVRAREGGRTDLWMLLAHEVLAQIGIHDAPTNRTIEPDGSPGLPLMAFGYYPTIGDLVKIARLYQAHGRWGGVQILYAAQIEALIAGTAPRGRTTGRRNRFGESTYFNAFWEERYDSPEGCHLYIPRMLGWGGNLITLMPGGFTGIRLAKAANEADPPVDDTTGMDAVTNRLTKFCH